MRYLDLMLVFSFLISLVALMIYNFMYFIIFILIIFCIYGAFFVFLIIDERINKDKIAEKKRLQSYEYKKNEMIKKYEWLNLDDLNYEKIICFLMFNWYIVETNDSVIILKKRNEIKIFKRNESTWENISFEYFMLNLRFQYSKLKIIQENYEKMTCLIYFGWSVNEIYNDVIKLVRNKEIKLIPLINEIDKK